MSTVVIVPPAPIVSLALAKQHLRVDDGADDALITLYVAAAQSSIDGPDGWLGRAVGAQTLEYRADRFDGWSPRIRLPYPPFIEAVSITYADALGVDQVLAGSAWLATAEGVEPVYGTAWPSGRTAVNAVRIRYRAGYATVPAPIVAATLLLAADLYANREAQTPAPNALAANLTVQSLLFPFRIWSV